MGNLAERLKELKELRDGDMSNAAHEMKEIVKSIPRVDHESIKDFLNQSLLSLFNSQNVVDEKRIGRIVNELSKQTKEQGESSGKHKEMMGKHHEIISGLKNSIESINERLNSLSNAVSMIKTDVDLSGVEKSIKQIKPTDITKLSNKIDDISYVMSQVKIPKAEKVDLSQVINEINKPKNVEFKVVTNQHGFPTKVIATER